MDLCQLQCTAHNCVLLNISSGQNFVSNLKAELCGQFIHFFKIIQVIFPLLGGTKKINPFLKLQILFFMWQIIVGFVSLSISEQKGKKLPIVKVG
jgi:hypothetical protein